MFLSTNLYKGNLYESIKEDIEEYFIDEYDKYNSIYLKDCILKVLDDCWEDVLDSEYYEDINEGRLWNLFIDNLEKDIDEKDLIECITPDDSYYGLTIGERNMFN